MDCVWSDSRAWMDRGVDFVVIDVYFSVRNNLPAMVHPMRYVSRLSTLFVPLTQALVSDPQPGDTFLTMDDITLQIHLILSISAI